MIKNAFLSLKKSLGKTLLLLIYMTIVIQLVMAGLSIRSATTKSMNQVRSSLGSEVTLSYNMQNMMKNREKGQAMDTVESAITVDMANQLKDLEYVENYNYTLSVGVTGEEIVPVKTSQENMQMGNIEQPRMMDQDDFTVVGNTTMAYLEEFTNDDYVLKSGRLLTKDDAYTKNCVIETNLALDNDLDVGDSFCVISTNSDGDKTEVELSIVGIYEVQTSTQLGSMMSHRQSPMNQIYTDLETSQVLYGNAKEISSASYYLDDPDHIEAFKELASSTDIDFETFTLDAHDQIYQRSIASLENMERFATIFLWVVMFAGSAIICLILVLTIRSRFYEFGVFLSLGQTKVKIIAQQLLEIGLIAVIAFTFSLGTGKMVSHVLSSMLEQTSNEQKTISIEIPNNQNENHNKQGLLERTFQAPSDSELDVSLSLETTGFLAEITAVICFVSVAVPSLYILRMSPREILVKREG